MELLKLFLHVFGIIFVALIFAGLARIFAPLSFVNGFMDVAKLKALCPELFKRKKKDDIEGS